MRQTKVYKQGTVGHNSDLRSMISNIIDSAIRDSDRYSGRFGISKVVAHSLLFNLKRHHAHK